MEEISIAGSKEHKIYFTIKKIAYSRINLTVHCIQL